MIITNSDKKFLDDLFYKNGLFTLGLNKFNEAINNSGIYMPQDKIRYYYKNQEITQLFKPRKRHKNINISESHKQFNKVYADTLFLTSANVAILNIIDYYSRFNYMFVFRISKQINSKRSSECLLKVIDDANKKGFKIHKVITDQGSEFYGQFDETCKTHDIFHEFSRVGDKTKMSPVESFNRTIRLMYERYRLIYNVNATNIFKVMKIINDIYNDSYHSSINDKPINILNSESTKEIKPKQNIEKLNINDDVRIYIKSENDPFNKLSPLWSREIYKIKSYNKETGYYKLFGLSKMFKLDELQKINVNELMIFNVKNKIK